MLREKFESKLGFERKRVGICVSSNAMVERQYARLEIRDSPSIYKKSIPVVLWLSYSPLHPRFADSNPAGVDEFFQSVKILSMTSFRREVKLWVRVVDLWHVKEPQAEIRAFKQNFRLFTLTVKSNAND